LRGENRKREERGGVVPGPPDKPPALGLIKAGKFERITDKQLLSLGPPDKAPALGPPDKAPVLGPPDKAPVLGPPDKAPVLGGPIGPPDKPPSVGMAAFTVIKNFSAPENIFITSRHQKYRDYRLNPGPARRGTPQRGKVGKKGR
jgi:hypothetical protein